jgi:membrane associated rhomboid family serine protease
VDYQANRQPVVTFTLISINVLVFLIEILAASDGNGGAFLREFGLVPAAHGWWAWVTSMFLHGGIFHLVGNMIYLFLFGACIEDILGRTKFTFFYLGGGLLANIMQVVLGGEANNYIPIVGASGAISACIGAFLVVLPKTHINFRYLFLWFYTGEFWLRSWIVISLWFIMDFISLLVSLNNPNSQGGVAVGAHVGGTVAGAICMLILRKKEAAEIEPAPAIRINQVMIAKSAPGESQPPVNLYLDGNQAGPYEVIQSATCWNSARFRSPRIIGARA